MSKKEEKRDREPVTRGELRAEIRGVEERLTAKIDGVKMELTAEIREVETRLEAKIDESAEETRRYLAVAVETITDEVRGGFRDASNDLRAKNRELEARVAALEAHTGLREVGV